MGESIYDILLFLSSGTFLAMEIMTTKIIPWIIILSACTLLSFIWSIQDLKSHLRSDMNLEEKK